MSSLLDVADITDMPDKTGLMSSVSGLLKLVSTQHKWGLIEWLRPMALYSHNVPWINPAYVVILMDDDSGEFETIMKLKGITCVEMGFDRTMVMLRPIDEEEYMTLGI